MVERVLTPHRAPGGPPQAGFLQSPPGRDLRGITDGVKIATFHPIRGWQGQL